MDTFIEMTLTSEFKSKHPPREGREPTVFARTLRYLIDRSKPGKIIHPGKIVPLYVEINGDQKVLGAFTFNTGGSVSFFPDLHELETFDHLTIDPDFLERGGHLTAVFPDGKRKKTLNFDAIQLESGDYHLVTFGMTDGDLMMDIFPSIKFPVITMEEKDSGEYLRILEDAMSKGSFRTRFPEEGDGIFCLQILITPKGKKKEDVRIYTNPITGFAKDVKDLDKPIFAHTLNIDGGESLNFLIYVSTFRIKGSIDKMFLAFSKRTD